MKTGIAYICIIDIDYDTLYRMEKLIAATYHPKGMCVRGNELLIPVPEKGGLGFGLNTLKKLVAPCRVEMFNLEIEDGKPVRFWYR